MTDAKFEKLARIFMLSLCALFFVVAAWGDTRVVHCLKGCPSGANPENDLIVRELFALSNNRDTKFADWVAYRVTSETIGTSKALQRQWQADPLLDAESTLEPKDYKDIAKALGSDRGHQAPMASFTGTVFWRSTNVLSNITPQKAALNRGAWLQLETAVRKLAFSRRLVYVVTGPLYAPDHPSIDFEPGMAPLHVGPSQLPNADEPHELPVGYWKVVALPHGDVAVFRFDQKTTLTNHCLGMTTLDVLENRTGLRFFPESEGWPKGELAQKLGC